MLRDTAVLPLITAELDVSPASALAVPALRHPLHQPLLRPVRCQRMALAVVPVARRARALPLETAARSTDSVARPLTSATLHASLPLAHAQAADLLPAPSRPALCRPRRPPRPPPLSSLRLRLPRLPPNRQRLPSLRTVSAAAHRAPHALARALVGAAALGEP